MIGGGGWGLPIFDSCDAQLLQQVVHFLEQGFPDLCVA